MSADLDQTLRQFAAAGPHPRLVDLEARVFQLIAAEQRSAARPATRVFVLAALTSATMGIASVAATATPVQAPPALSPFGPATPMAPATLLGDSI